MENTHNTPQSYPKLPRLYRVPIINLFIQNKNDAQLTFKSLNTEKFLSESYEHLKKQAEFMEIISGFA